MKSKTIRKRALAWLLSAAMALGLVPAAALAAPPPEDPQDKPYEETATVAVKYGDTGRSTATITYRKAGIPAEPVNVIFLVDLSTTGRESHRAFETMLWDSGVSYLYDYGVNSRVQLITYQNTVLSSGTATTRQELLNLMQHPTAGEGTARESTALAEAAQAVQDAHGANDDPTVVFWVLGESFGEGEDAFAEELAALEGALTDGEDALITWQLADSPSELLARYVTHHGDAHDPDADIVAAHAEADPVLFRSELAADLEQAVHDHYHNIDFSLKLAEGQTLVQEITGARIQSSSSYVSCSSQVTADGVDVHLEHVCRQVDLDFVLEVALDTGVYTQEPVIPGGTIFVPEDHSRGGLHIGIFDDGIAPTGLTLHLPEAVLDRTRSTMTFTDGAGGTTAVIQQIVGTTAAIPGGDGLSDPGGSFGGWNVVSGPNQGVHYNAGEIISMPSGEMVLEPAWGHVEVELEIDYEQGTVSLYGNQLHTDGKMRGLLNLSGARLNGQAIGWRAIKSVTFADALLDYVPKSDPADPRRVEVPGRPEIVYARHVGQTENDLVVAYLVPSSVDPGSYDMYVVGPGGVKAPADASKMFDNQSSSSHLHNLERIDLSGLDTSGVTNMTQMFSYCDRLTTLDVGTMDVSNVLSMNLMFFQCHRLETINGMETWNAASIRSLYRMFDESGVRTLDVSGFQLGNVSSLAGMFRNCANLTEIRGLDQWDTKNVINMSDLFRGSHQLTPETLRQVEGWNTAKVTTMSCMFSAEGGASGYASRNTTLTELDLSRWDVSSLKDAGYLLRGYAALERVDLSGWDPAVLEDTDSMFTGCSALQSVTVDWSKFQAVTTAASMFSGCSALKTLDLSQWRPAALAKASNMFDGCTSLSALNVSGLITDACTPLNGMFRRCESLTTDGLTGVDTWNTSNVTTMSSLFFGCVKLESPPVTQFDVTNVGGMDNMFSGCTAMEELDLSGWRPTKVSSIYSIFSGCSQLRDLKLPDSWVTSQTTNVATAFRDCAALTSLDLSGWDTSSVINFNSVFNGCTALTDLKLGWNIGAASGGFDRMFAGCPAQKVELSWNDGENAAQGLSEMFLDSKVKEVAFITPAGATFEKLAIMMSMFRNSEVERVDMGGMELPNLTNTATMFAGCSSLEEVDLSWSGILSAADRFTVTSMFSSVPQTAALEIGSDSTSRAVMEKIADTFPGSVTVDGAPRGGTNAINTLPEPELPQEGMPETGAPQEPAETPDGGQPAGEEDVAEGEQGEEGAGEVPDRPDGPEDGPGEPADHPDGPEGTPEETLPPEGDQAPEGGLPPEESVIPEEPERPPEETSAPEDTEAPEVGDPSGETPAPLSAAGMASYRALGAANQPAVGPLAVPGGDSSLDIYPEEVESYDTITYKVTIKYVGDPMARSGRIEMEFPIPEGIVEYIGNGGDSPGWNVAYTYPEYSGAPSGYLGGRFVGEPEVVSDGKGGHLLRAAVEGIYTGTEVTVSIITTVDVIQDSDYQYENNAYAYFDGTAYANGMPSNTVRLWAHRGGDTPPTETDHRLTYRLVGEIPPDVSALPVQRHQAGAQVSAAAEPHTNHTYYEFSGWVRSDDQQTVLPGSNFTMPDSDLTLTGTWSINGALAPKVTVTYQYQSFGEAGYEHVPDGAPELPGEIISEDPQGQHIHAQEILVGSSPAVVQILEHADNHIFLGWTPGLTIGGDQVALTETSAGSRVYQGTHQGSSYVIDLSGSAPILQTEQFRDVAGQGVTIAFTGPWRPYTADILFDANGGEGTMEPLRNVTWDTHGMALPKNRFTYPVSGYQFVGWAVSPSGTVVKTDGELADGLITRDGENVTLYAVWRRSGFEVGYSLTNVTSSNTSRTVALGGTYSTILTPAAGYEMDTVSITMGGRELSIDSTVYEPDTGAVNIPDVDGDIIIRAEAVPVSEPPVPERHTVRISVTNGTASPSGTISVGEGEDLTITFVPDSGYTLSSVTVDGTPASLTGNLYTFSNITQDHAIAVIYVKNGGGDGGDGGATIRYTIEASAGSGGSISPEGRVRVDRGSSQTFRITPSEGWEIADVRVDGTYVGAVDRYTFEHVRANHTIEAVFRRVEEAGPPEVADPGDTGVSDWLNTADHMAYLNGYPDGQFGPADDMTRAEVAQMFYNLLLEKNVPVTVYFTDVPGDRWYAGPVNTLASLGILQGVGEGQFAPERAITRAEFTAIAMRFAKLDTGGENLFSDVSEEDWFYDYVVGSIQYGWITGYEDGTFRPNRTITRAEVTTITNRMLGRAADEDYVDTHRSELRQFSDLGTGYWAYYQIVEATNDHSYTGDSGAEVWTGLR